MKSQEEIVKRIEAKKDVDVFGFEREVLIDALDFEHARPYLKPEVKAEEWKPGCVTDDTAKKEALGYIDFAWDKAENHRGLSAERSVAKMTQFLWLLGMDELVGRIERDEIPYRNYGAPILKVVSEALGYKVPEAEELRRMMEGLPCRPDCEEGCGR